MSKGIQMYKKQDNIRYLRLLFVVEDMCYMHEEFSELEK